MNGFIRGAALAGLFSAATYAYAQPAPTPSGPAFPNKPIRIVVPFAAGGPIDIMTRPLAQRLNEAMGVTVLVDNRAGANGISLPNVPTMAESGYPQIEAYNWYAVFAPGSTPKPIIARLNSKIVRVMSNPAMKSFAQGQGAEPVSSTPEELGAMHKREFEKWGGIVRAAGIKPE